MFRFSKNPFLICESAVKNLKMTKISILGCGWLGLPLAKAVLQNGFVVKGSTTSIEKLSLLYEVGITPFLIALSEKETTGNLSEFLADSEILIIDVPPKLRGSETENFVSKIKNIVPFLEKSTVQKVLFISSTSVYNDDEAFVTKETIPKPDTESGKQLLETEQLLQSNINFQMLHHHIRNQRVHFKTRFFPHHLLFFKPTQFCQKRQIRRNIVNVKQSQMRFQKIAVKGRSHRQ